MADQTITGKIDINFNEFIDDETLRDGFEKDSIIQEAIRYIDNMLEQLNDVTEGELAYQTKSDLMNHVWSVKGQNGIIDQLTKFKDLLKGDTK